jgi:hypothetical protein
MPNFVGHCLPQSLSYIAAFNLKRQSSLTKPHQLNKDLPEESPLLANPVIVGVRIWGTT